MVNVSSGESDDVIVTDISQLAQDVSLLYLNQKFSDLTFILDEQKIHAHKVILAARSGYFEALLYTDLQHSDQSEVPITDVSSEAFQKILKYIYTGTIVISPSKIDLTLEVMSLAHKYLLKDLESTIMNKSKLILNMQNVCPMLNAANLYDLEELRNTCHNILDQHASEIVANDECFNKLIQISLVKLLERDSFFAPEADIFKRVAKWCEFNQDVDNLVMQCVRLSQLTVVEIVSIVWPTKLIDNELLLSAIAEIVEVKPNTSRSRARLLLDENLATPDQKSEVITGNNSATILSGNRDRNKYAFHPIGSGDQNGITIKLAVKSFINHISLKLWDGDDRFYCYYIEASVDQKKWKKVIDYRQYACRATQDLFFDTEKAQYIRVVGTRNTIHHNEFHLIFFEAYQSSKIPKVLNGITYPTVNVVTPEKSTVVIEGTNGNALLNNADGHKGYAYHAIGSGHITIQLGQPYMVSSMKLRLWDQDARFYKYYIEASVNNSDWVTIHDRRNENCKSWQTINFEERALVFIRITGTFNSADNNFHVFHVECPASE